MALWSFQFLSSSVSCLGEDVVPESGSPSHPRSLTCPGYGGMGPGAGASQAPCPVTLAATLCLEFFSLLQVRRLGSHTGRRSCAVCAALSALSLPSGLKSPRLGRMSVCLTAALLAEAD